MLKKKINLLQNKNKESGNKEKFKKIQNEEEKQSEIAAKLFERNERLKNLNLF